MAYRMDLLSSAGYAGYEYAYRTKQAEGADEEANLKAVHNNLRDAANIVVTTALAAQSVICLGARTVMGNNASTPNYYAVQQSGGSVENWSVAGSSFARTPFVGIRKDGDKGIILTAKPIGGRVAINPFDVEQEKLLKKLFPGYQHPKEWARTTPSANPKPKYAFAENLSGSMDSQAFFALVNGEFSDYLRSEIRESPEYQSMKKMPKGVGISFSAKLIVDKQNRPMEGMNFTLTSLEGAIPNSAAISANVEIVPELHLPLNYAHWALFCEEDSEFVPFLFMTHINSLIRTAAGAHEKAKEPPRLFGEMSKKAAREWDKAKARKPTPVSMARRNKRKEKVLGYVPMIKTNEDGYIVTAKDRIFRVPTEGKMGEYQAAATKWFNELSETEVSEMADGKGPRFKFPPSILYVDHHNEVMVYTNLDGAVTTQNGNLRGARPLDPITIAKRYPEAMHGVLNARFIWDKPENVTALGFEGQATLELLMSLARVKELMPLLPKVAIGMTIKPEALNPLRVDFEEHDWSRVLNAIKRVTSIGSNQENTYRNYYDAIVNGTKEERFKAESEFIKLLNTGAAQISRVVHKIWVKGDFVEEDTAVMTRLELDSYLYIVAMHTEKVAEYHKQRWDNEANNEVSDLDRDKPIVLPNIDQNKLSFVFPHQGQFIQKVDVAEPPKYAVIGAAPGGGKTICIVADILLLLQKGRIKRPVVVVPNNLVRQFVAEINEFSDGKVNAFALTYQHVKDVLMNPVGMNYSLSELIAYIRDLPPNTIIVTNYNTLRNEFNEPALKELYADLPSYDNFGQALPLRAYPYVDVLAAAGVDYVCGDESHKIKNPESRLSQAFLCLCAKAEYVRLSSGTTINNVVTDLVGQMQKMNAAILGGDTAKFAEEFLGDDKARIISLPEQADEIRGAMREYALVMQKDSRSWDYMLPQMREVYHRVSMTDTQARYYNILFDRQINRIQEDSKLKKAFQDIEDAENKNQKPEDEEKLNSKIERAIKKHFSVIDRFINDPSQFPDFVDGSFVYEEYMLKNGGEEAEPGSLPPAKVTDIDTLSVKASRAYDLMYAHLNERGKLAQIQKGPNLDGEGGIPNWTPDIVNKAIIMAPNRFVGNHVWDRMPADLKKRAVRYTAGAFSKVEAFKNDPNIKFMIADETSISEGHNLQVGSRIIRLQQVWTPGGETQSLARIRRPDPFAKFARDALGYDIIVATMPSGSPTIDDLRIARLLAKKFNNAMVEFGFEASFRNKFMRGDQAALPPIRMSMKNIRAFNEALLNQYFDQQEKFYAWFAESSLAETKKIGQEVEALTGKKLLREDGRPINVKDFVQAVVLPTTEGAELQGSQRCYVPWLPGVQPINPLGFDMQPIRSMTASLEDDDDGDDDEDGPIRDDDDEDGEEAGSIEDANAKLDNVKVELNMLVMTEFGPGQVTRFMRGSKKNGHTNLEVTIPGVLGKNGKPLIVRLPKTCIYVPQEDDMSAAKQLAQAYKSKSGVPAKPPKQNAIKPEQRQEANKRKQEREGTKPGKDEDEFLDYENEDDFDLEDFDLEEIEDDFDDEIEDTIDLLNLEEEDLEAEEEEEEEEDDAVEPTLAAYAISINGQLAIYADDEDEGGAGLNALYTSYAFKPFPDMARIKFTTRKSLDAFLAKLVKAKYAIPRPNMAEIMAVAEGLTNRSKLRQVEPVDYTEIKNFLRIEHRLVPKKAGSDPQTIRLYPLVMNGDFYLAAAASKHPFPLVPLINRLAAGIPGVGKAQKLEDLAIKFYPNMSSAKKDAKKIIADDLLVDPQELLNSFDEIQNGNITMGPSDTPKPKETDLRPPKSVTAPKPDTSKPVRKLTQQEEPPVEEYQEQEFYPGVEDIAEFRTFLTRASRATLTLTNIGKNKAWADLKGKSLLVRRVPKDGKTFEVSTSRSDTPDDYIALEMPSSGKFLFDMDNSTMTTPSGLVFRLTYSGKTR